ncbi:MAG: DUF1622 domain-containing protein [Actinomycetota bacterium]|nr:DUF1622 domain-containing protein [Actinomycetota bacterium]
MELTADLAALATAAGTLILLAGLAHAALAPARAAVVFARAVLLALEFFLAAGLLRLSESTSLTALATAAAVIAVRTLVSRSLQPIARGPCREPFHGSGAGNR